jgi:hypothetical protein
MENEEKDFLDDVDENTIKPKKKQLSEQKLQHLQNIRVKALEKKKERFSQKSSIFMPRLR